MKKTLIALALLLAGCFTDSDEATNALRAHGFRDIRFGGTALFSCGKNDKMGLEFRAKNPVGEEVEGVVCCGVFKGCTVRF